jgi:hypothetical protein
LNLSWDTTQVVGQTIGTYNVGNSLLADTYIASRISYFRYFKAGLKVILQLSCSRELSGCLMLVYVPLRTYYPENSNTVATSRTYGSIYEASGSPHWLAFASANTVVEANTPFINPRRACDLREIANSELGQWSVIVAAPLVAADGTAQFAQVTITACFTDAQLYMPCDTSVAASLGWQITEAKIAWHKKHVLVCAQICGMHGSKTNTDDHTYSILKPKEFPLVEEEQAFYELQRTTDFNCIYTESFFLDQFYGQEGFDEVYDYVTNREANRFARTHPDEIEMPNLEPATSFDEEYWEEFDFEEINLNGRRRIRRRLAEIPPLVPPADILQMDTFDRSFSPELISWSDPEDHPISYEVYPHEEYESESEGSVAFIDGSHGEKTNQDDHSGAMDWYMSHAAGSLTASNFNQFADDCLLQEKTELLNWFFRTLRGITDAECRARASITGSRLPLLTRATYLVALAQIHQENLQLLRIIVNMHPDCEGSIEVPVRFVACSGSEAKAKAKTGMISKTLETVSTITSGLSSVPYIGQYTKAFSRATGLAGQAAKMFGLDKPRTLDNGQLVNLNPNYHMNYGRGIDIFPSLGNDPENAISTAPIMGGIPADECTYAYLAGTGMINSITTWLAGSTPIQTGTTGTDANLVFCDYLKLMHNFWSGSHKFKMYFVATIYHAVRFVIYYADAPNSDWTKCYNKIVEVQGTTEVEFTVPYAQNSIMSTGVITNTPVWSVYVKILSWSQQVAAVSCPITIISYKAAASDMRYEGLLDVTYTASSARWVACSKQVSTGNPREDFNHDFPPMHPSQMGYKHTAIVIGEETTTIRDQFHRIIPQGSHTGNYGASIMPTTAVSGTTWQGVDIWSIFYRFWRGSVNVKFINSRTTTTTYPCGAVSQSTGFLAPAFVGSACANPTNNNLEYSVPFYEPVAYEPCNGTAYFNRTLLTQSNGNFYRCKGLGDDFSFHWLTAPPAGSFSNTANTAGVLGLVTFGKSS